MQEVQQVNKPAFLIGQAQKDFWNWYLSEDVLRSHKLMSMHRFSNDNVIKISFLAYSKTAQNALILEWFDSVKIYIYTKPFMVNGAKTQWEFYIGETVKHPLLFNSRKKALIDAIKKANKIYNEQNIK